MPIKRKTVSNGDGEVAFPVAQARFHGLAVRLNSGSGTLTLRSIANEQSLDIGTFKASADDRFYSVTGEWAVEVTAGTCTFEITAIPERN